MENGLKRAARAALRPNAIIVGVGACLFGWAVAESLRPEWAHGDFYRPFPGEALFISCMLFAASAALATGRAWGSLLAAVLSGPLPLLQIYLITMSAYDSGAAFLSAEHIEDWLRELGRIPADFWLMTALSAAILCSASAATLRRTPPRP